MPDQCNRCGGGIDRDHPTTCSACLYELVTGRRYEADVDRSRLVSRDDKAASSRGQAPPPRRNAPSRPAPVTGRHD